MAAQYIYGNTNINYTISGIRIPSKENVKKAENWKPWTAVDSKQYSMLLKDPLFDELLKQGKVTVSSIVPEAAIPLRENLPAQAPLKDPFKDDDDEED